MTPCGATAVVDFWREAGPAPWFKKDDAFDAQFRDRFLERGLDDQVQQPLRNFMSLPLQHSEDPQDHELAVTLATPLGGEALHWALHHREIIRRFGRFPHRNAVLGRASNPEEEAFIAKGGFGG